MGWMRRMAALALVLLAGLTPAGAQQQQQGARLALVIGNAAYTTPGWALKNPVNDATLIADRLRALGFTVDPVMNASKARMEQAMGAFAARLRAAGPEAVGVFYYAGHAAEHDGANVLVPVDVRAGTMDELRYQAPPLNFLLRDMARAGNRVNIVVLDACRDLPLPAGTRSGPAGGLAGLDDVPTNILLAYATRAGATAPDNPSDTNSIFTRTLAAALRDNAGEPVSVLFETVQARGERDGVRAEAGVSQPAAAGAGVPARRRGAAGKRCRTPTARSARAYCIAGEGTKLRSGDDLVPAGRDANAHCRKTERGRGRPRSGQRVP